MFRENIFNGFTFLTDVMGAGRGGDTGSVPVRCNKTFNMLLLFIDIFLTIAHNYMVQDVRIHVQDGSNEDTNYNKHLNSLNSSLLLIKRLFLGIQHFLYNFLSIIL